MECHTSPQRVDETLICGTGTRYCRDGKWGSCESVVQFTRPAASARVIRKAGGLYQCSGCDPLCFQARDTPTQADLQGDSSEGVQYVPEAGGIGLQPREPGMDPSLEDSDGDGVVDAADECDGDGFRAPCDGTASEDGFYHVLPLGGPAELDPLDLSIRIRTADVYFLMDTTGSMDGEIETLQRDLTTGVFSTGCDGGIIGSIQCTIPDAWFGVGHFDDYPVEPYGGAAEGDIVYGHAKDIDADVAAAQQAVNDLELHYGSDGPESQSQALWAMATGRGLGEYLPARTGCADGRWGYPCFREGTVPIVVLMTDAEFHNGTNTALDYTGLGSQPEVPTNPPVDANNDQLSRAVDLGDVTDRWVSQAGNLCGRIDRRADCTYWSSGGEAYYKFSVRERTEITLTLQGTQVTYPTLTLLRSNQVYDSCAAWPSAPPQLVRTLDPGEYYVVVDNYWHGCDDYQLTVGKAPPVPPTDYPVAWSDALSSLRDRGVKVITVQSCDGQAWCAGGVDDAKALANATQSVDSAGKTLIFPISESGAGLSSSVVDAVVDLADYSRMDVTARAVDNPDTPEDERALVEAITAVAHDPGRCESIDGGSRFVQCLPGTGVDFRVAFRNPGFPQMTETRVFEFAIQVLGDGQYELKRVPVRIVIPAEVATYPEPGNYWKQYDASSSCSGETERPQWESLAWTADLPPGTTLRFDLRTADTEEALADAEVISVAAQNVASPVDLAPLLEEAGVSRNHNLLRIGAHLGPSPDELKTPVLQGWELTVHCVFAE